MARVPVNDEVLVRSHGIEAVLGSQYSLQRIWQWSYERGHQLGRSFHHRSRFIRAHLRLGLIRIRGGRFDTPMDSKLDTLSVDIRETVEELAAENADRYPGAPAAV